MDLEEQITQGCLAWTDRIVHDETACTLTIEFKRDPEQPTIYGILRFDEIAGYSSVLDYEADRVEFEAGLFTENLLGIHEQPLGDTKQNYIKTETREISFLTSVSPIWLPVSLKEIG